MISSIARMRSGLFVPIFDALADPALVARLSAEAEEAGWDGVFVWDHVRWREPVLEVADASARDPVPVVLPADLEDPSQLAEAVVEIASLRKEIGRDVKEPFDVIAALPPSTDPSPYASAGATWWMVEFPWERVSVVQVRGVIREGPAPSG